jgi:hypothetical protein
MFHTCNLRRTSDQFQTTIDNRHLRSESVGAVTGRTVLRLTPDLKDAGVFDYHADGRKSGSVENISPDGSTLGNATGPGYEFIDAGSLKSTKLTDSPAYATSVSSKGFRDRQCALDGKIP